ncbi:MAG: sulfotransferase [Pseudomonadota bacterium]
MAGADPIFVLAPPFSGASLLAGVLDRHPQLAAVPELDLFMADSVGELLEIFALGQDTHGQGLLRALAEFEFGDQSDAGVARAQTWLRARVQWSSAVLLQSLAAMVAPRRLVIPDTESPLRPSDLQRLRRAAPDARVLQCLRHPYSVGVHHAAWLSDRLFVPIDFKDHGLPLPAIDPQLAWYRVHCNLERHLQAPGPLGEAPLPLLRVRIEDLEVSPQPCLRELCGWLELEATPAALSAMQAPQDWVFAGYGPRAAPYGLDPDLLEEIRVPRAWPTTPTLEGPLPWRPDGATFGGRLVQLARDYGYC